MADDPKPGALTRDFSFHLPPEAIAGRPLAKRDASRLMCLDLGGGQGVSHHHFDDLPGLLEPGDLLVLNDTRVYPARIEARKPRTGGRIQLLLVEPLDEAGGTAVGRWKVMVKGRLRAGEAVTLSGGLTGTADENLGDGFWAFGFGGADVPGHLDRHGHIPLPPYIHRADDAADRDDYQTVFAQHTGSVAAPTSGLHFTDAVFAALMARGVAHCFVTLHVGPGTFLPVRTEHIDDHVMHAERYEITPQAVAAIQKTQAGGGRIIACGSTVTRTLESAAAADGKIAAGRGISCLFIHPGYRFKVVDGLVTNFHLPGSTLVMMVAALVGRERLLDAYREALDTGYRFFSYGDAMLLLNRTGDRGKILAE